MRDPRGGYTSTKPASELGPPPGTSGVKHRGTLLTPQPTYPDPGISERGDRTWMDWMVWGLLAGAIAFSVWATIMLVT